MPLLAQYVSLRKLSNVNFNDQNKTAKIFGLYINKVFSETPVNPAVNDFSFMELVDILNVANTQATTLRIVDYIHTTINNPLYNKTMPSILKLLDKLC